MESEGFNVTTDLERRLIGALGGFLGATAADPTLAETVLRAAEIPKEQLEAALKNEDHFNCTMWNLCNNAIGADMLTHAEITAQREARNA